MLQTMQEGKDGVVSWREVCCGKRVADGDGHQWEGDADDFVQLFETEWRAELDVVEGDSVLMLPCQQPVGWDCPWDMVRALDSGLLDNEFVNPVLTAQAGSMHVTGRAGHGQGSAVIGRVQRSGPMTRSQSQLAEDSVMEPSQRKALPGRRPKRENRYSALVRVEVCVDQNVRERERSLVGGKEKGRD